MKTDKGTHIPSLHGGRQDGLAPPEIRNPLTGKKTTPQNGYWIIGTQNPVSLRGRNELPAALLMRSALIQVPAYTPTQEQEIVTRDVDETMKLASQALWDVAAEVSHKSSIQFDIRVYRRPRHRRSFVCDSLPTFLLRRSLAWSRFPSSMFSFDRLPSPSSSSGISESMAPLLRYVVESVDRK